MTGDTGGYKFLKFEAIDPVNLENIEPIETDAPCEQILRESIYDLIRMAKEIGVDDDTIDGVLNRILEERAEEIRSGFQVHERDETDESDS